MRSGIDEHLKEGMLKAQYLQVNSAKHLSRGRSVKLSILEKI